MLGFILINGLAVIISKKTADKISTKKINIISSLIFIGISIIMLIYY